MKLHVLGNYGPFPAPHGATSGYLLEAGETRICMDMGTGVLAALTARMPPEQLSALVLTHWHFDHCSDTLPLLYRLQATGKGLRIYAPADPSSAVRKVLKESPCVELLDIAQGDTVQIGDVRMTVYPAVHPVPGVMLRMESVSDGRVLCYTGDTNRNSALETFAEGADLLLADGLFPHAMWSEDKPHLSARLCAELALKAHVGRLRITHLNPTIAPETLEREAREIFPDAAVTFSGEICQV